MHATIFVLGRGHEGQRASCWDMGVSHGGRRPERHARAGSGRAEGMYELHTGHATRRDDWCVEAQWVVLWHF
jgi:hypothetical protein